MMVLVEKIMLDKVIYDLEVDIIFRYLPNLYNVRKWSLVLYLILSFLLVKWVDKLRFPFLCKLALLDREIN